MPDTIEKETFVGTDVPRIEDASLLSGHALYADDYAIRPGTLHGAILRSPHARARIVSVDVSDAMAVPGVHAVLTGKDIREVSDPFLVILKQPLHEWAIAAEEVRFVGEAVALVLADDRYIAEDALDKVRIEYEVLEPAVAPEDAAKDDIVIHEPAGTNVVSDRTFKYGNPAGAFEDADRTISLNLTYPRNSLTPIEGFVVLATFDREYDLYDVLSNFQGPYTGHPVMARSMRVPETHMRLRTPSNSGGSFGIKQAVLPYIVMMCCAAKITGRPIKWVEDRLEHLTAATSAPNRVIDIEAAVNNDGRVLGLRFDQLDDYGAYLRSPMPGPLYRMHGAMTGAYEIPNLEVRNRLVMTNKTPAGLVRGFGGPQMYYAVERLMHHVAVELGLDPLDVIRKNLIPNDRFPYKAAAGAIYDSGDYQKAVDNAVADGGLEELIQRREKARAEGKIYGIGFATVVEPSMSNMGYLSTITEAGERHRRGQQDGAVSMATVNVDALGGVSVTADTTPQGQGHATVMAQIVADQLGIRPEKIRVVTEHDTNKDPWSIAAGTYSCRFTPGTAVATHLAAQKVRDKLGRIAAQTLNVSQDEIDFADGQIFAKNNPDNAVRFSRVAGSAHWSPGGLPEGVEGAVRETAVWAPPELAHPDDEDRINTSLAYGFVFDFCGIEIDPDTGDIRIDKYVSMHDSGSILNPTIAEGQVYGAFGQAVGAALYESFEYSADGNFLSGTFADYLVPTACEVPEPELLHIETPSPFTPLGAKGIGEGNCMSTPVCIANALADALGVSDITLPLKPGRVSELFFGEETPPPAESAAAAAEAAPAIEGARKITGSGETFVPAAPEAVWDTVLDPEKLAAVIPGCHSLDKVGDNAYRAEVSLGVGPVKGKFVATVNLSDLDPPKSATLSGGLEGPLGASQGAGRVTLEPDGTGTHVSYDYTVEVGGRVAAVGGRMLDGAARVVVGQFFDRLTRQLGDGDGGAPPSQADGESPSLWKKLTGKRGDAE